LPDKLEVLPGAGLVARFGEVVVWAGPQASSALQGHLVAEARRAAQAHQGGEQVANSLISVLQRGDPEPHSPFAVVGPGPAGALTLFLHGPVQAWDSGRWLAPQPVPGWLTTQIGRPWPLIVLPYGASPPPQSEQGNPLDLVTGVVPGSGFVLLRPVSAPSAGTAPAGTAVSAQTGTLGASSSGPSYSPLGPGPVATPEASGEPGLAPGASPTGTRGAQTGTLSATSTTATSGYGTAPVPGTTGGPTASGGTAPAVGTASAGLGAGLLAGAPTGPAPLDLRHVLVPSSPPLPLASTAGHGLGEGRPEATGVYCERGHFNHPGSTRCLRCGRAIPAGAQAVAGPRPAVGALLADDGSVWVLDKTFLIGADPSSAPEVRAGSARPIRMLAGANHTMAAVQAEVRVTGWNAYLVDRGADGGTYWRGPTAESWSQLGRGEQRDLVDGSHLSCGGRVLTFLSAWPAQA